MLGAWCRLLGSFEFLGGEGGVMGRSASESVVLAWERRIARQRRCPLSVAAFCRREGVSVASFYAWRRRLSQADSAGLQSPLFVPVELSPLVSAAGVRIELPGGAVLSLPTDAPLELVTAAIRAVMASALSPSALARERPAC
jgi:hypothetical protein